MTRSFIEFDLSFLPDKAEIIKATLDLFQNKELAAKYETYRHLKLSGSNLCLLQRIISPWSEETISWNTQPQTTEKNQVVIPESQNEIENYRIDVSQLVRDIINNRSASYGFMVRLVDETPYRSLVFCSTDTPDMNLYPKLTIIYK